MYHRLAEWDRQGSKPDQFIDTNKSANSTTIQKILNNNKTTVTQRVQEERLLKTSYNYKQAKSEERTED